MLSKREFKQSFDTKDQTSALLKLGEYNRDVERQLALAEKQTALGRNLTPSEVREVASNFLQRLGLHPDQMPVLRPNADKTAKLDFAEKRQAWKDRYDRFFEDFLGTQEVGVDPATWTTLYKPNDPLDAWQAAYRIIDGEVPASIKKTWQQAFEDYLEVNKQDKRRNPHKQKTFEAKTRRLFEKFAMFVGGLDKPLEEIDRQQARAFLNSYREVPKPAQEGTIGRYSSSLGAVFNFARQEYQDPNIKNPFEGLRKMSLEHENALGRRSFLPSELAAYEKALLSKPVIGLIGLVMIYTGCRPSEAAGLEVADLRLDSATPHIRFKHNTFRRLDKGSLERSVPVAPPLLNALKNIALNDDSTAGVFGKYSEARSYSNVSIQLNNLIREKLKITDPALVSYSTRHTFKDRGRAARIVPEVTDYLQGHVTKSSSAIAQRYGTGVPPSVYAEDIEKIFATKVWGDNG